MRIVIAGASGFVGQMLVPELRARGADVMLLGRDPEALQAKFPECAVSDYANLSQVLQGADLLLNLAVVNSDAGASLSAYQAVNVEFAATLAQAAQDAGVRYINVSSTHALEAANRSAYAQSKRDGVAAVDAVGGCRASLSARDLWRDIRRRAAPSKPLTHASGAVCLWPDFGAEADSVRDAACGVAVSSRAHGPA